MHTLWAGTSCDMATAYEGTMVAAPEREYAFSLGHHGEIFGSYIALPRYEINSKQLPLVG